MRHVWVAGLAGALLAVACAGPKVQTPPVFPVDVVAVAEGLVDRGCYDCLIRARDTYRALVQGPFRAEILPRLFEAELLLVMRHKELAMAFDGPRADLQRTADTLPAVFDAQKFLAIVDALPEDEAGISQRETVAFARDHEAWRETVAAEVAWLRASPLRPPVRQYVARALECVAAYAPRRPAAGRNAPPAAVPERIPEDEAPLVSYGEGICALRPSRARLEVAAALVPEFHEASFAVARDWLTDAARFGTARSAALMAAVLPHFPDSPSVAFVAGQIQQTRAECAAAITAYDRVIALRPQHENAMLGRVMCLSHLKRHAEAIAQATTLIPAGGTTVAYAYYWRAWNHHQIGSLPAARADVESAKRSASAVEFHVLAGIIEYDQDDLDPAMSDLRRATSMSEGRSCPAHWYTALVYIKRTSWPDAARSFERAMDCYALNVRIARARIDGLERDPDLDATFRTEEITRLQSGIVEDERQRHAAAINGAKNFANAGDFTTAVRLGTIALEDPSLAAEVDVLREYLVARKAPVQLPPAYTAQVPERPGLQ